MARTTVGEFSATSVVIVSSPSSRFAVRLSSGSPPSTSTVTPLPASMRGWPGGGLAGDRRVGAEEVIAITAVHDHVVRGGVGGAVEGRDVDVDGLDVGHPEVVGDRDLIGPAERADVDGLDRAEVLRDRGDVAR